MEVYRQDVKTGAFILIALLLFCYGVFEAGGILERLSPGRQITLSFENALRVTPGTEVVYRGKKIGSVSEIILVDGGESIEIVCSVDPEVNLYAEMQARIEDKSALGGKLIEIYPPETPRDSWTLLAEGTVIKGLPASNLTSLITNLNITVVELRESADVLLTKAGVLLQELETTVINTSERFKRISDLAPKINETLEEYKGLASNLNAQTTALGKKLDGNLDSILPTIKTTLDDYDKLARRLEEEARALKVEIAATLENTNSLMGSTEEMVLENREELNRTLTLLNETLVHLQVFSERVGERPSAIIFSKKKSVDGDEEK